MATTKVFVDGKEVEVEKGTTVLEACHRGGADVPHFCYHPGLPNAANCRMCLVQIEGQRKPVPACNMPVADNMKIQSSGPTVEPLRKSVLEFLLINHPLDCPICDKAGECMLQDNYYRYSRKPSVMKDPKVHKPKKTDVNDRIIYDGERCILCSRCVRFSEHVSKTKQIGIEDRGDHAIVSFPKTGPYEDPYSDNVVDICPVGALTSKKFRFNARVWNLDNTKSVCGGCSRNCNIEVHHQNNRLHRVIPAFNGKINQYWMCNFGRDFMTRNIQDFRIKVPQMKNAEGQMTLVDWEQAMAELMGLIKKSKKILFIGSRYLSNEEWWALKCFKEEHAPSATIALDIERTKEFDELKEDNILVKADKHPNSHTAEKLATTKEVSDLNYDLIIDFTEFGRPVPVNTKMVKFSTFRSYVDKTPYMLLPLAHPLEKSGTYTNFEGINSSFTKALHYVDAARSLDSVLQNYCRIKEIPKELVTVEVSNLPIEEAFPNVVNPGGDEGYLFKETPAVKS